MYEDQVIGMNADWVQHQLIEHSIDDDCASDAHIMANAIAQAQIDIQ